MTSADTTPEAAEVQRAVWRRLSPQERIRIAAEMSEDTRQLTLSGIAAQHPELGHAGRVRELIWRMHGVDIGDHSLER